ncbi:hypothetical protein Tco_1164443, partial [Tanacetum coccineum]
MMRYGLLWILWERQSQLTSNIPKTKPLHVGTEVRSSVSSGGGAVSPQEEEQCLRERRRTSVSSRGEVMSPWEEEQCLLR